MIRPITFLVKEHVHMGDIKVDSENQEGYVKAYLEQQEKGRKRVYGDLPESECVKIAASKLAEKSERIEQKDRVTLKDSRPIINPESPGVTSVRERVLGEIEAQPVPRSLEGRVKPNQAKKNTA